MSKNFSNKDTENRIVKEKDTDNLSEYQNEAQDDSQNEDMDEEYALLKHTDSLYESSQEKYKDNLSSAITFFVCGIAGIVILALNFFGVINLIARGSNNFIFVNVVLLAVFLIFVGIGVWSLKYSKQIKANVKKEDESVREIYDWLAKNVTKDDIEASCDMDAAEEMKYFSRSEYIGNAIRKQFEDADDKLVESITDSYIEKLFS